MTVICAFDLEPDQCFGFHQRSMSTGVTAKDQDQGLGQRDVIDPHRDTVARIAALLKPPSPSVVANRRRHVSRCLPWCLDREGKLILDHMTVDGENMVPDVDRPGGQVIRKRDDQKLAVRIVAMAG